MRRHLTIRCILCGRKLTKSDITVLSETDKFSSVFSLQDKILWRTDRCLSTYIVHTEEARPTLLYLRNGWHQVSCFSGSEYKRARVRTIGVLNNKIYWDDFPHAKEDTCNPPCQLLTSSWINHLMGIVPAERQPIDPKTRELVLATTDGKCARCGRVRDVELHHRRPVIHGGTNDPSNLIALCHKCHFHRSHEFTEHIWPDLVRIFVESESPTHEVAVPTLGAEFWHLGSSIEGIFDSSRLCKSGKAYKLMLESPITLDGKVCSVVEIPSLFGFQLALDYLRYKGYQPRKGDSWEVSCTAVRKARQKEGFSDSPQFQINVLRHAVDV